MFVLLITCRPNGGGLSGMSHDDVEPNEYYT